MRSRIIKDHFIWIPEHERITFPPRRPDPRTAMLWIDSTREFSDEYRELFLINNSGKSIEVIQSFSEGIAPDDDGLIVATDEKGYVYRNIEDGWGVKISEFDDYYDLDYVIGFQVFIKSEHLGNILITSSGVKGGHRRIDTLLWDTGETGRNFSIKRFSNHVTKSDLGP